MRKEESRCLYVIANTTENSIYSAYTISVLFILTCSSIFYRESCVTVTVITVGIYWITTAFIRK